MNKECPIIALDFPTGKEALDFVDLFERESLNVKIGMELFYIEGPRIVQELRSRGHNIFLDLKLHDIPNTVKSAMNSLARLEIDMVTVHCQGGLKMLEAAIEGLESGTQQTEQPPLIVGITQLTSTSPKHVHSEQLLDSQITLEESVLKYAQLAKQAGLDGVVSSPLESKAIKQTISSNFSVVTPGIRMDINPMDDQIRIATPAQAAQLQSDYIVVGRPITQAKNPVLVYQTITTEWQNARKTLNKEV
ncbi:orotidine-5'-phosphate decarboxylase [Aerococcaceae bacterium DSM 111020]|nr:orotidine-5'-phosphate decarboxylase [Aerococcaceae bacterium DSM 111020]